MIKRNYLLVASLSFAIIGCTSGSEDKFESSSLKAYKSRKNSEKISQTTSYNVPEIDSNSNFSLNIIEVEDGWGYEVFKDSTLLIRQKNIPAVQGVKVLISKTQAETLGSFVLSKVKNGQFPPSVSIQELDSLNIEY